MHRKSFYLILFILVFGLAGSAPADLVGYWKLDEGSGTDAYDSSGNGNDGTLQGAPEWVAGVLGGALRVAGDDWVDCGNVLELTDAITICCWVNPDAPGGEQGFVGRSGNYALKGHGTGVRFTTPGILDHSSANITLEGGAWQHIAATFVPSQTGGLIFYYNGEEAERLDSSAINPGTGPLLLASNQWGENLVGVIDDVRIYDHILTPEEIVEAMKGTSPGVATNPSPATEATDVPRDVVLSWTAGEFAATHDVYLGTSLDDVNAASRANPLGVLVSQGQSDAAYDSPDLLDFDQTYYWRIDEVNAAPDNTIFKGDIWSLTTEPFAYPIEGVTATTNGVSDAGVGPENTVNGSGLNAADQHSTNSDDMWLATAPAAGESLWVQYEFDRVYKLHELLVWNYNVEFELILGFGLKDVTVEYSTDGVDWTVLGDVQLNQATAKNTYTANTAVDLQGVAAKYVRLTVISGYGFMGQYGLSEVRFMYIPTQAREPQPADGATDVDVNTSLTWRAGREAVSHEVYLSTDEAAVAEGTALVDTVGAASYTPTDLEFGRMYYWKITEVNEAEAISSWVSDVWSFVTQEYAWIDDFESYTDDIEAGQAIFDTWIDGWINDNGSTVGYFDAPFAEGTIVNSGKQSMPLQYSNVDSPWYSEAVRTWDAPQDWTGNSADTLVVNLRGNPPVFLERADGSILMGSTGGDIWGTADAFRMAYKTLSGDGSIVARVDSIVNTSAWAKGGVMIRNSLDAGATHAMVVVTPGNGVALQNRPTMNQASLSINEAGLTAPYWVKLTRTGDTLKAERSADGTTWVSITADAAASSVTIPMGNDVYIGLALVSNNAGASPTAAEFSNVSTTGNVSGQWQTEDIGGGQLPSNDPEPVYVRVEDTSGNTATVVDPDAEVAVSLSWQEWQIPFSDLSGVNLSRVHSLTIGVGNPDSPAPGGAGILYIDDIGFGSPYVAPPAP